MISNHDLLVYLDQQLQPHLFKDFCHNGLQVEGKRDICKIITGVSISLDLINAAILEQADAIIVHHGLLWNKDISPIVATKRNRLFQLMQHNINLFAYHLPLDNHKELGNNVQLAKLLDIVVDGNHDYLWFGYLKHAVSLCQLRRQLELKLQHTVQVLPDVERKIKRVAWCTGDGASLFNQAIQLDVDAYITGEVRESIFEIAKESNVNYIVAGHYATERYGILALTEAIQHQLKLDVKFVECCNPI